MDEFGRCFPSAFSVVLSAVLCAVLWYNLSPSQQAVRESHYVSYLILNSLSCVWECFLCLVLSVFFFFFLSS